MASPHSKCCRTTRVLRHECGLTPPSSGRRPASFAVWPPPLMSNVRQHEGRASRSMYVRTNPISIAAHLNRRPETADRPQHEPPLEATSVLLPASSSRISCIRRLPAAVRAASSHEAEPRAVGACRQDIQRASNLNPTRLPRSALLPAGRRGDCRAGSCTIATACGSSCPAAAAPIARRGRAEPMSPNPSIERTFQRPLRTLWSTVHVGR